MSNDVAIRDQGTVLTLAANQQEFNQAQVATLRQLGVKDAGREDLAVFFHQCVRTGLDPFARQIYMIGRWSKEGTKQTIQTGIDGYRLIARRASDRRHETLEYEDTLWCGEDGAWREVWLSPQHPAASKVTVIRNGGRYPAVALWTEYVQTVKSGDPNSMWARMGANQLAKCAEALALRKAFPQDLSGIYTDEEMAQADNNQPMIQRAVPTTSSVRNAMQEAAAPVESVIVDDEPGVVMITREQSTDLAALLTQAGHDTPEGKLMALSDIVGYTVTNPNTLTHDDAEKALAFLNGEYDPTMDPTWGQEATA